MQQIGDVVRLSPTDLSAFLGCRHRTGLDLSLAQGILVKPEWNDPLALALQRRGEAHERNYVAALKAQELRVVDLRDAADGTTATLEAVRDGVDVLVQAVLESSGWRGYVDVLRRVETPSDLGTWSYEVYDTKLARETRGGTILQLAVYSELLGNLQGTMPQSFHVVTPDPIAPVHSYRFDDYAAYYRFMRRCLLDTLALGPETIRGAHYPEPVDACEVCRWRGRCDDRRRQDDHLSFIAGIGRLHRAELEARGITTLAAAATLRLPLEFNPSRGSKETYERFREQARVQYEQRTRPEPVFELLPVEPGQGLAELPAPSPGDLFVDLEGARFARDGGRDYLFGVWSTDYQHWWAYNDTEERPAFEAVVDIIMRAWTAHPGMHVYHFGNYEETAFKRLMGRHATRGEEIDRLLRGGRFVDLHRIVRRTLRAGVESYSLKQLERFYAFKRDVPLAHASRHLQAVELALEGDAPDALTAEMREAVAGYNRDDCRSAQSLRDWLERLRVEVEAAGTTVPRPEPAEGEATEKVNALNQEAEAIRRTLLAGLCPDASDPRHPEHPLWLLAYLVDWHRREDKAQWWDYFRVRELSDEDLLDEPKALIGLEFVDRLETVVNKRTHKPTGSLIDRYRYPAQEIEFRRSTKLKLRNGGQFGEVTAIDRTALTIDVKKGPSRANLHPDVVFVADVVSSETVQHAVMRLAATPKAATCGLDLLDRQTPRLASGSFQRPPGESEEDFAIRVVGDLDRSTLAIQGPPGSGKTYTGARMIRSLVAAGKRVGVTAVSHKVIRNLLDATQKQATKAGERIRMAQKVSETTESGSPVREIEDNEVALAALRNGEVRVLGGTAWLWAREDAANVVDVLIVDEAGQMSLANALAVSQAANSIVLLGDPQQLDQPQKGTHPDGVNVSALEHVLGLEKTMPPALGIFLPHTRRLAPAICAFTSEMFYEGKLQPLLGLERQRLSGTGPLDGAGLWWVPVDHDRNQNWSLEEVEVVAHLVDRLLGPGAAWVNADGVTKPLTANDLRVVAPYNAQVNRLAERLAGRGVPVGTVDKFQGQEAPIVIYSMATSRPEEAPRGMEFLYSLNRLNVATSRARCAAILVASPRLFEADCRTPRQMRLANALCRFRELATPVSSTSQSLGTELSQGR